MPAAAHIAKAQETLQLRADLYGLLGTLLGQMPNQTMLDALGALEVGADNDPLAQVIGELAALAGKSDVETLRDAYTALFIGVGRGELVPFASWYLSGFVMDKSLATLRETLATLGFERAEGVHEPEDHIAALCEVMAQLIQEGDEGIDVQRDFYTRFLASWAPKFFKDLQNAATAGEFYQIVGQLGEKLFITEKQYLEAAS